MKGLRPILLSVICLLFGLSAVAGVPERIISLAPSLTQSIYSMDAKDRLVGCTYYCSQAVKDGKTVVGTAMKVNIEKALSLKPDLVVASSFTTPKEIETLRKFGVKVLLLESPRSYDEICKQFVTLGEAIGKKPKALQLVANSRATVKKIYDKRKTSAPKDVPSIFIQIGADPLFAVIPNTFMADYAKFLGYRNITEGLKGGQISEEFVVQKNPDYIFVVTMGSLSASERTKWMRLKSLKAVRDSRVHVIDASIACEPSPVTFARTMTVLDDLVK